MLTDNYTTIRNNFNNKIDLNYYILMNLKEISKWEIKDHADERINTFRRAESQD